MNRDAIVAALVNAGMRAETAVAKVPLFDQCDVLRARLDWAAADHAWWIPGRLEVFGKHTDYAGGRTLVAALPRGLAMFAGPGFSSATAVRAADARTGEVVEVPARKDEQQRPAWAIYVDTVVGRLTRNFPGVVLSANILFASDLPPAAGMSSSSALIVGLAAALVRLAGIESRDEWQRNINGPLDRAAYYACIENGATFGSLSGDTGVGTHGGSEDHAAILCGSPSQVTAFSFVPLELVARAALPAEWRFVVASSGVRAEKTGAAQDVYNALAQDVATLLGLWNAHEPVVGSLGAALASDPSARGRLVEIIHRAHPSDPARRALEERLDHFIREDARVPEALAAFDASDAAALTVLASESQRDAEVLLRNQVPETIALASAARELGAIGACSFGAGFGGSVWALVHRDDAPTFTARWMAACGPALPSALAFEANPGPGLTELSASGFRLPADSGS